MDTRQFSLKTGQKKALDRIMSGADTFVTGGAGTGKSVVAVEAIRELESQGKNVVVCAPTGIAAMNIGGTTIHKAFGFKTGPCIAEKSLKLSVRAPKLIKMADIILIDEISMCRMDMMDAVCASIKRAEELTSHRIQRVVFGDFCQLPPVLVEGSGERELLEEYYERPVGQAFAFQAPGWKDCHFNPVVLNEVVRQKDEGFIRNLNSLRIGDVSAIPYFNTFASFNGGSSAVRLYARNEDVDNINERELNRLRGDTGIFSPIYYGDMSVAPDKTNPVYLKKGARVIVTTNQGEAVDRKKPYTLHNGCVGTVVDFSSDATDPTGDYVVVVLGDGSEYLIFRQIQDVYTHRTDSEGHVRRQVACQISYMPVKLAYAMTIHRSQGQTFDSVELDPSCRISGQTYVGLSRVRTIDGLKLTRKLTAKDVYLAPIVKEFYAHLNDEEYVWSWEKDPAEVVRSDALSSRRQQPATCKIIEFQSRRPGENPGTQEEMPNYTAVKIVDDDDIPKEDAAYLSKEELSKSIGGESFLPAAESISRVSEMCPVEDHQPQKEHFQPKINDKPSKSDRPSSKKKTLVNKEKGAYKRKEPVHKKDSVPITKKGRRRRYPTESVVCRIPVEIQEEITFMLGLICPSTGMNQDELERFKRTLRKMCGLDE